jgi:LemA protein
VKGYAEHERETLNAVVEARSRATAMQLPADIQSRPELLKQFQANQDTLTNALSRLLVVVERYPDLKANQNFLTLQSQLEGTENRIAVARRDYIDAVKVYNTELRTYPGKWWHALLYSELQPRANFEAPAELQRAPAVDFRTR